MSSESCAHPSKILIDDDAGWQCYDCGAILGWPDEPVTAEREGLVEEIAGVLAEHVEQAGGLFCSCQPEDMHGRLPLATTWETHLADALADLLAARDRRVRAEALRSLADETRRMPADPDKAAAWLRDRADRIDPAQTAAATEENRP